MPKTEIDYSNTIIYKITCIDDNIKDVYVGHTTNFVQRKHAHKQCCINEKYGNCKLYDVIRNNGGWNNWNMEIINFFNCKDHYEARIKEQEYFVLLNANLNSIEPLQKHKPKIIKEKLIFFCDKCNIYCENLNLFEIHNNTNKHCTKIAKNYYCEKCDYKCYKKYNWEKHINTSKHNQEALETVCVAKSGEKWQKNVCEKCDKSFHTNSGLWKHNKICKNINNIEATVEDIDENKKLYEPTDKELIMIVVQQNAVLIKENCDLKNMMMEVIKKYS
jgi:hypothetical protein